MLTPTTLAVAPPTYEMASHEALTFACDFTATLPATVTVASAACTLTRLGDGADVGSTGLVGSADASAAPVVKQHVHELTGGEWYRLVWLATLSDGDVKAAELLIHCVF